MSDAAPNWTQPALGPTRRAGARVPLEGIWGPLDRARRVLIGWLGRPGKVLVRDRAIRVTVTAVLWMAVALIGASTVPMWMLALGPILLGVPHVLGDVRYLVVRRGLHRRKLLVVLAGGPLLAAWLDASLVAALLACFGAALAARAPLWRRGLVAAGVLGTIVAAWWYGYWSDVFFAHAHNIIGVLLWWLWRPRSKLLYLAVVVYALCVALLWFGVTDPLLEATGGLGHAWAGFDADDMQWSLAPGLAPELALRLMLTFAFAQSIHYAVWLRLMPEDDRGRETPRTFRASWAALYRDLGPLLLAGAFLSALAVGIWACVELADARLGYLRAAVFHGFLELIALTLLLAEGRPGRLSGAAERRLERRGSD